MKNIRYMVIGLTISYCGNGIALNGPVQVKNDTSETLQVAILRARGSDKELLQSDDVAGIDVQTLRPNSTVSVQRPFIKPGVDRYVVVSDTDRNVNFVRTFSGIKGLYRKLPQALEDLHGKNKGTFAFAPAGYTNGSKFTVVRVGTELIIKPGI